MNKKVITLTIIGLCILSIIVGLVNTVVISKKQANAVSDDTGFRKIFKGSSKIALVSLNGEITSESSDSLFAESNTAEGLKKSLKKAFEDNTVKGILIRVNSPGGTVGLSQEIYSMIMKGRKKKPVVVSMVDLAASGGYYISSAADRIFAEPGTLTGSVGVIMSTMNAQKLFNDKLGIQSVVIKSGKFKDIGSPYRPMTTDERALLQNVINSTYHQFVNAIIAGRVKRDDCYPVKRSALTVANLKKYADGRILTGEQAVKLGFVDELGGQSEAYDAINKMLGRKTRSKLPLVPYNAPSSFEELFTDASKSFIPDKEILKSHLPLSAKYPHKPLYAWE